MGTEKGRNQRLPPLNKCFPLELKQLWWTSRKGYDSHLITNHKIRGHLCLLEEGKNACRKEHWQYVGLGGDAVPTTRDRSGHSGRGWGPDPRASGFRVRKRSLAVPESWCQGTAGHIKAPPHATVPTAVPTAWGVPCYLYASKHLKMPIPPLGWRTWSFNEVKKKKTQLFMAFQQVAKPDLEIKPYWLQSPRLNWKEREWVL